APTLSKSARRRGRKEASIRARLLEQIQNDAADAANGVLNTGTNGYCLDENGDTIVADWDSISRHK
ncbi:MAG: hypothetical protein Q9226_004980, partial [Calogaya cf. arnoldii]